MVVLSEFLSAAQSGLDGAGAAGGGGGAAVGWIAYARRRAGWVVLAGFVGYYLFMGSGKLIFVRYALPLLARLYEQEDRLAEAEQVYGRLVALYPEQADFWSGLGQVQFAVGSHAEALASYTEALARQPDHPVTYNNLAVAYWAMGEEQVALRHWCRAAELDPYYAAPRRNLGIVHAKAGRYAEAIQALEQVLALEPTQADVYFKIAQAYHYGLGQPEQALRYWEGDIGYAAGDADALSVA